MTDCVSQVPLDYATTVCNLFAQLGARGSSIMFSSGDDGVGAGDCLTNDGKSTKHFQPNFPGTHLLLAELRSRAHAYFSARPLACVQ